MYVFGGWWPLGVNNNSEWLLFGSQTKAFDCVGVEEVTEQMVEAERKAQAPKQPATEKQIEESRRASGILYHRLHATGTRSSVRPSTADLLRTVLAGLAPGEPHVEKFKDLEFTVEDSKHLCLVGCAVFQTIIRHGHKVRALSVM